MSLIENPLKNKGLINLEGVCKGNVRDDHSNVSKLLKYCPISKETPLTVIDTLTAQLNLKKIAFKDERTRMNLGSFKALGAAFVIAKSAYRKIGEDGCYGISY